MYLRDASPIAWVEPTREIFDSANVETYNKKTAVIRLKDLISIK